MKQLATPKQILKNESPQQYYGIAQLTNAPTVRGFSCALGQYLKKYIAPDIQFSYQWVKLPDNKVYFAVIGSRAVQDVFEKYLIHNRGDYYGSASFVSYGRDSFAFNRVFGRCLEQGLSSASGGTNS